MGTIIFVDRNFKKTPNNQRRAVEKGIEKLRTMIEQYEEQGMPFERICNNDTLKYDVLGGNFFTYKIQSQQLPLRVLYRFKRKDSDFEIEVHLAYIKKYKDKRYIQEFEDYVTGQSRHVKSATIPTPAPCY